MESDSNQAELNHQDSLEVDQVDDSFYIDLANHEITAAFKDGTTAETTAETTADITAEATGEATAVDTAGTDDTNQPNTSTENAAAPNIALPPKKDEKIYVNPKVLEGYKARKHDIKLFKGYQYIFAKKNKKTETEYYECKLRKSGCYGRLRVNKDGTHEVTQEHTTHGPSNVKSKIVKVS